ncbi:MAG TPA: S-layer homology domain-containing protein, partial [Chloroflexia bacterium]|nr:S-layer homology domain-containing protein [Chloroflexia bacterium]
YSAVTRSQLAKIVDLAAGWALISPAVPHFSDVPLTHPLYAAVETAYAHGNISGYADGSFHPAANATRGQISKIVYGALPAWAAPPGGPLPAP